MHTSRGGSKMYGDETTLAEWLDTAGYNTGIFGKWHLGDNYPMRPQDQGFTSSLVHRGWGIGAAPDDSNTYFDPTLWKDGEKIQAKGYCSDVFTDAAIEFIKANQNNPFFVYLSTNAPHYPLVVDKSYSQPYLDMGLDEKLAKVYGMLANIDENMGRLLSVVDQPGLRENTIVIFMGDNGPNTERYTCGLRGKKLDTYEGGIRVPFFIRWPGHTGQGTQINSIAAHIDIVPTMLDICGISPEGALPLDGVSLLPLLNGNDRDWPERELFFQCHRGLSPQPFRNCAAVGQRFKMVGGAGTFPKTDPVPESNPVLELYDLQADPSESNNVAEQYPQVLAAMKDDYQRWFEDVRSSRNFKPELIYLGTEHENPVLLCRYQDGTYSDTENKPLGWDVFVKSAGNYEFTVNQDTFEDEGTICLSINGNQESKLLAPDENKGVFTLPAGKSRIDIWLQENGKPRTVFTESNSLGDVNARYLGK